MYIPIRREERTATTPSMAASVGLMRAEGISFERIHPTTRRIIETLFPPDTCAGAFILRLLALAVLPPGTSQGVQGDAAIVSVRQGCAELSKRVQLSYDTTHMCLVIYRTLGLVSVTKQEGNTLILIPLQAYQPPAELSEQLQQLQTRYLQKRPRMRRLIAHVIERLGPLLEEKQEQQPYHAELLIRVQYLLSTHGVADPEGKIAQHIVTEVAPFVTSPATMPIAAEEAQKGQKCLSRSSTEKIPVPSALVESTFPGEPTRSDRQQPESETADMHPSQNLVNTTTRVRVHRTGERIRSCASLRSEIDSSEHCPRKVRTHKQGIFVGGDVPRVHKDSFQESRPTVTARDNAGTAKQRRFDEESLFLRQQMRKNSEKRTVSRSRFEAKNLSVALNAGVPGATSPASTARNPHDGVDSKILSLNGNGIGEKNNGNITQFIPDPDPDLTASTSGHKQPSEQIPPPCPHPTIRQQAKGLAMLIEGNEENLGAYIDLLRRYDPQVIRAGVIATLLRKHFPSGRKALRAPGGYFTRQVQRYQESIPEQIVELLDTYAQASYEEIEAAMEKQAREQSRYRRSAVSPASQTVSRAIPGMPMDEAMATRLAGRIAAEDPYVEVRGICKMQDGAYVVNVYIDPMDYCYYSVEEWERYHAEMQALDQEVS